MHIIFSDLQLAAGKTTLFTKVQNMLQQTVANAFAASMHGRSNQSNVARTSICRIAVKKNETKHTGTILMCKQLSMALQLFEVRRIVRNK